MKKKPAAKSKRKVQPIPKGFHALTPYIMVQGASEAMEFYKKAFGAKVRYKMPGPDGKSVAHGEMIIGDSIFMMADGSPQALAKSPKALNGTSTGFVLYVKNTPAAFDRAVKAGATVKYPIRDMFYGERTGTVEDPYGHIWTFMTHIEDVPPAEMKRRMTEFCEKMGKMQPNPEQAVCAETA